MTRTKTSKPKNTSKKNAKQPNTKTVYIATDEEAAEEHEDAKQELEKLEMRLKARPENVLMLAQRDQLWERLDEAEKALRASSIKFVLRAIGHKNYDKLVEEHPVTEKFREEIEKEGGDINTFPWNPETFPVALIARSLVDEEGEFGSEEEIIDWLNGDDWNSAELNALFSAALEANTSRKIVQMGNGYRPTRN